jgi:hypothetical protein
MLTEKQLGKILKADLIKMIMEMRAEAQAATSIPPRSLRSADESNSRNH